MIATSREFELKPSAALRSALGCVAKAGVHLALTGLDAEAVKRFVGTISPARADRPFVDLLLRETGGNPFFLSEVIGAVGGGMGRSDNPPELRPTNAVSAVVSDWV